MPRHAHRHQLFDRWVQEHRGILVKVCRAYAITPSDAADLDHEILLQLWNSTENFAGQAKESTWIYRVCLNTALMWRRTKSRRENRIDADADIAMVSAGGATPADTATRTDLVETLYRAIHTLPDFDRALTLLMMDGLAYREIAEVTGLTENHVGVALTRARKRLLERMKGVVNELE